MTAASAVAQPRLDESFLRRVLRHIEAHLLEWDQLRWCHETPDVTTYCFAGWAYVLGTGERPFSVGDLVVGFSQPIPETARRLLGLTEAQAEKLFLYTSRPNPRHPETALPITFRDLCRQVYHVTGVRYRPGQPDATPA